MSNLWFLLLDERIRLSRIIAIPSVLLGVIIFVYGVYAPNSFWIGCALAAACVAFGVGVWILGDWRKARQRP